MKPDFSAIGPEIDRIVGEEIKKMKPILTTTKSLSVMPIEITRQTRLEIDKCNLAIFRANMAVKKLEKKR